MTKSIDITGYKVKKELGAGGMAKVYLALDSKLDRPVALKVLSPAFAENSRITKRFIKEAKTAAQLQHSNIVSIFDVGKQGGMYYFAMEYLQENLKDRLKRGTGIKPREALAIIKDVAKALSYAHKKGYVHRDIKPDNIMFRKDGAVVLVDFGIVKAVNEKTKLTRTGISVGTPQYMSPEQIKAKKIDGRSDIYSLGIVLYELLTGQVPYQADDLVKLAMQHTGDPVPQLPVRLKDFQPLIEKMLAKNPHERVRNAEGLIRLIEALDFKIKERTTKIQQAPSARRKKIPLVIFLLVVIGMAVGSGYLILESKRKQETIAWQTAKSTHTIPAYQEYLEQYPMGRYQKEADRAIEGIKRDQQFQRLFNQAEAYFNQGNYEKALKRINEARQIKVTPGLKALDQKIKRQLAEK
ncbi:MAG: protein kinase [Candidatus Aminicenantes bacterium]|nr:MAG: protein kinase [Candidatus Aminicenantes bacterium]